MSGNNNKTAKDGWTVEIYSGVAVHESGFSVFIVDSYNRVASQHQQQFTTKYLAEHNISMEELYFAGKDILVQSIVNKAHRLQIDMAFIRKVQLRRKELAK